MSKNSSFVKVENLSVSIKRINILRNISFTLSYRGITGIVGPNGAGKSTLIKAIVGLVPISSGKIIFNNKKSRTVYDRLEFISYMPETLSLYPDLKAGEFIEFVNSSVLPNKQLEKALNLERERNKRIKLLSKGYKQRLKLYQTLVTGKKLIILDEPFDGFDPLQLVELIELFKNMKKEGITFIMSIHNLSYAERICDNFVLLKEGNLVGYGSMDFLADKFKTEKNLENIFLKALQ